DQQAQVELGEVGQQSLAVQRQVGQSHRRVAQLDRAHDQELVAEPAHQLAHGDSDGPGEGVRPRADVAGEGRGELAEQQGSRGVATTEIVPQASSSKNVSRSGAVQMVCDAAYAIMTNAATTTAPT